VAGADVAGAVVAAVEGADAGSADAEGSGTDVAGADEAGAETADCPAFELGRRYQKPAAPAMMTRPTGESARWSTKRKGRNKSCGAVARQVTTNNPTAFTILSCRASWGSRCWLRRAMLEVER